MNNIVQANLKPETIERIQDISGKPVTRGIDGLINECFDKLEENSDQKDTHKVTVCEGIRSVMQDEEE